MQNSCNHYLGQEMELSCWEMLSGMSTGISLYFTAGCAMNGYAMNPRAWPLLAQVIFKVATMKKKVFCCRHHEEEGNAFLWDRQQTYLQLAKTSRFPKSHDSCTVMQYSANADTHMGPLYHSPEAWGARENLLSVACCTTHKKSFF